MKIYRPLTCPNCNGKRRTRTDAYPDEVEFTDLWEWCEACGGSGVVEAIYDLGTDGTEVLYWPRSPDEAFARRRLE